MTLTIKIEINEKTRQSAENKQTFDLTAKIEFEGKTRQNFKGKSPTLLLKLSIRLRFELVTPHG